MVKKKGGEKKVVKLSFTDSALDFIKNTYSEDELNSKALAIYRYICQN